MYNCTKFSTEFFCGIPFRTVTCLIPWNINKLYQTNIFSHLEIGLQLINWFVDCKQKFYLVRFLIANKGQIVDCNQRSERAIILQSPSAAATSVLLSQIQGPVLEYKCTNTNTQMKIHKHNYTNGNTQTQIHCTYMIASLLLSQIQIGRKNKVCQKSLLWLRIVVEFVFEFVFPCGISSSKVSLVRLKGCVPQPMSRPPFGR